MKRKIFCILLALMLVLNFSLMTAVPVAAYPNPAPIALGSASSFAVIAASTITNADYATAITGNMGLSPNGLTSITGFIGGGTPATPGTVSGTIYTGNATSIAGLARADAGTAYGAAMTAGGAPDKTVSGNLNIMGNGGSATFYPGVYHSTSSLSIAATPITLDAQGNANAVWIFDMDTTLTTTSGGSVILANEAKASNVFWRVGSSATLGAASFKGTILANTSITLGGAATINVEGRLLAACVNAGAVEFAGAAHTVAKPVTTTVGGKVYPINKANMLLPWLVLALIIVIGGSALVLRRRTSR